MVGRIGVGHAGTRILSLSSVVTRPVSLAIAISTPAELRFSSREGLRPGLKELGPAFVLLRARVSFGHAVHRFVGHEWSTVSIALRLPPANCAFGDAAIAEAFTLPVKDTPF